MMSITETAQPEDKTDNTPRLSNDQWEDADE